MATPDEDRVELDRLLRDDGCPAGTRIADWLTWREKGEFGLREAHLWNPGLREEYVAVLDVPPPNPERTTRMLELAGRMGRRADA